MPKTAAILTLNFQEDEVEQLSKFIKNENQPCKFTNKMGKELNLIQKRINGFQLIIIKASNSISDDQNLVRNINEISPFLSIILVIEETIEKYEIFFTDPQIIDIRTFEPINLLAKSVYRELKLQNHQKLLLQAQDNIKSERKHLGKLLQNSSDGFILIQDGRYQQINNSYKEFFDIPKNEDLIGRSINEFETLGTPSNKSDLKKSHLNSSLSTLPNEKTSSVHLLTRNNNSLITTLYKSEYVLNGKKIIQVLIQNPNLLSNTEVDPEDLRNLDIETGLFNKQFFIKHITNKLELAAPTGNLAIILIDDFRNLCEGNSFTYSSSVLQSIIKEISSSIAPNDIFARFGNHVFAIFSEDSSNSQFLLLIESIFTNINNMLFGLNEQYTKISLSIGISVINQDTTTAQQFIAQADKACEIANIQGGKQIFVHDSIPTPLEVVEKKEENILLIQSALQHNRLHTLYQPIVDLSSKSDENYAVLLRILDFEGKHIQPNHFIHAAEDSGLIVDLDKWVLSNTIQQIKNAEQQGIKRRFFLTLSTTSYQDENFIQSLVSKTKFYDIDTSLLVFQIDMNEAIIHPLELKDFISQLKANTSCQIALDQVGFSEIDNQMLEDYSVDFLKVDGSVTQKIRYSTDSMNLLKKILDVSHKNNTRTIAKSVEDADTMAMLWNLGIDGVQGYFLQKPSNQMSYDFDLNT